MKWCGILFIAYGAFLLGFFFAALLRAGKGSAGYNPPPQDARRPEQPTPRPPAKP